MRCEMGLPIWTFIFLTTALCQALAQEGAQPVEVRSDALKVVFNPDLPGFDVTDRRIGYTYNSYPAGVAGTVKSLAATPDAITCAIEFPVKDKPPLSVACRLTVNGSALTVEVTGAGEAEMEPVAFPCPILLDTPGAHLISTAREGLLFPVRDVKNYSGRGVWRGMACSGAVDVRRNCGYLLVADTPDDMELRSATVRPQAEPFLALAPTLLPQLGKFGYTRRLIYFFTDKGGHVALAKFYRDHVAKKGMLVLFKDKKKKGIPLLMGAMNVHSAGLTECKAFKAAGIREALINTTRDVAEAQKLGYLVGRYDVYTDVLDPEFLTPNDTWSLGWRFPDDMFKNRKGEFLPVGYRTVDPKTKKVMMRYRPCQKATVDVVKREDRGVGVVKRNGYLAYFFDVTTSWDLAECWNPLHVASRTEDKIARREQFDCIGKLDGGVLIGSEDGKDWALPYAEYFEGLMSTGLTYNELQELPWSCPLPSEAHLRNNFSPALRIPFFELVYHGAVQNYWWWIDNPIVHPQTWAQRDLMNILHANPPIYRFHNPELRTFFYLNLDRFLDTYRNVCLWAKAVGYDEMVSHWRSEDGNLHRSDFSSGLSVTVDFAKSTFKIAGDAAAHPELPVGREVKVDAAWSPIDAGFEFKAFQGVSGWLPAPGLTLRRNTEEVRPCPGRETQKLVTSALVKDRDPVGSGELRGKTTQKGPALSTRDFKLLPRTTYAFTGWLRLAETTGGNAIPRFSIVQLDAGGNEVGRTDSPPYDPAKPATWQNLKAGIKTAPNAEGARIQVLVSGENGFSGTLQVDDITFVASEVEL